MQSDGDLDRALRQIVSYITGKGGYALVDRELLTACRRTEHPSNTDDCSAQLHDLQWPDDKRYHYVSTSSVVFVHQSVLMLSAQLRDLYVFLPLPLLRAIPRFHLSIITLMCSHRVAEPRHCLRTFVSMHEVSIDLPDLAFLTIRNPTPTWFLVSQLGPSDRSSR